MNESLPYGSLFKKPKPVKKQRKPLRRSQKPVRKRTSKRASEEARYRRRVKVWLSETYNQLCRACQLRRKTFIDWSKECHHRNGKVGRLLNYEPFWIPVCSACHNWIHRENPEEAQRLSLLGNAGEWNNQNLCNQNLVPKD